MSKKKQIGQTIAKARKNKGISYYRIDTDKGVQRKVVKSIERGDSSYTIDSLLAVADAVGVSVKVE
jgi:transcriptional regulator with XRE-family HTH domain